MEGFNMQYGIFDEDSGKWLEETTGLDYDACLQIGYDVIGRGKLPEVDQTEKLKFLYANHFDIRPMGAGCN